MMADQTETQPAPPAPVVQVGGWMPQPHSVMFSINAPGNDQLLAERIKVEYSVDQENWQLGEERQVTTMSGGDRPHGTGFPISHLESGTTYYLRSAQKFDNSEWSEWSPIVSAKTALEAIPRQPWTDVERYNAARERNQGTYLERFTAMVEALRAHPRVQVKLFKTFEPITDAEVEAVHKVVGHALHPSILAFFRQTNGLQLRWRLLDEGQPKRPESDEALPWQQVDEYDGSVLGDIVIPPLITIVSTDWDGQLYFDFMNDLTHTFQGKEYVLLDFSKRLKPCDLFNTYTVPSFFLDGQDPDPPLLIGTDHGADFGSSFATDFHSYLEFLIATKGLHTSRSTYYGVWGGADRAPRFLTPMEYWADKQVSLDFLASNNADLYTYSE